MAKKSDPTARLVAAAMQLAAEQGWRATSLADIALRAEVPLADLYRETPSKAAILEAVARQADAMVLAAGPADAEESRHDRMFDVLMRRFDALAPHKAGLHAVWRELRHHPLDGLCLTAQLHRSMRWMLEAAGIARAGFGGVLQVKGLSAVWLATLRPWFGDDSEDMAKTMAALDANLRRAEELWNSLPLQRSGFIGRKSASP
ncbi:TetR/AcrR family transcriptional regulator [Oleisolibacter albus]|uniref:TetR/AcrR family transcriptional regulator n=1 Tax=Oleisolibacter albus TaxID=2171757 RepID=UPI00138FB2A7|nr:TetR/AcrR family transcriptional regulator [Oleisolibacter albus]